MVPVPLVIASPVSIVIDVELFTVTVAVEELEDKSIYSPAATVPPEGPLVWLNAALEIQIKSCFCVSVNVPE